MILADKITDLRKKNGWSQEELAGMLDVSRQSISKWESAQSTPDMNRILKLSELFGVSTDYLLKDDMELPVPESSSDIRMPEEARARRVSMEEAGAFLAFRELSSGRISIGVLMCILSPVLLISLTVLQEAGILAIRESTASGIGLVFLIVLIGGAVALFVTTGLRGAGFEYLEKEEIDTEYGVDGMVKDRREKYRSTYSMHLVIGILLCVMAVFPLFISMIFFGENDAAYGIAVAVMLVVISIGCLLIVRSGIIWGSYQILLQEGEYTAEKKAENRRNQHIAPIYWGSVTAVFLGASFLTNAWDKTWIIWAVAGVAYGVVLAVAAAVRKK